ncbi:MAG TPA: helix-turn-helix transcriptional regulator [Bacilli bacterium]|nr:helix-turn-helix transcriptional regulator [Bacilli bacterium]
MNQERIGKFIFECRKTKKLTQSELAEKLGVTDKSISNWENGRNMPDLSLFKPLYEILDISINDLISGERVEKDKYQEKLEENIISTIDYTNKKVSEKNSLIGIILIVFGIMISIIAMTIFPSESSWGSIYSVFGCIISLIGISRFTIKLTHLKRLIFNFGYFILFVSMLFIIDYISVVNVKQAPRFSIYTITAETTIYYDTPFYDVVRCDRDTKNEYYKVMKNQSYDEDNIVNYCK